MRARRVTLALALCLGFAFARGIGLDREQGECLSDQSDDSSWSHIQSGILLEDGEAVSAFCGAALMLNGAAMALVPNRRLITHCTAVKTDLSLSEVACIEFGDDMIGEAIEVGTVSGRTVRKPIAPLHGIGTFQAVLRSARAAHE